MQRKKIPSSSWKIIETIVMRYPEWKREYKAIEDMSYEQIEDILNSPHMIRIRGEIEAVGKVFNQMTPEAKDVIVKRFWNKESKKKISYCSIDNIYISKKTMQDIVHDFFELVGEAIGEL